MISEESNEVIRFLVEKSMKGIRKQLSGYVRRTLEEIECSNRILASRVESQVEDFKRLYKQGHELKKDWSAVEMMLKESEQMKKTMFEICEVHSQVMNELMDMRLLNIEHRQKLQYSNPFGD